MEAAKGTTMAGDLTPLDVTDTPEILRLAEEVARPGVSRVLRHDGKDLAVIGPAPSNGHRQSPAASTPLTSPNAWLEDLIGMGQSDGPTDVSANIHTYVAEATHAEGRHSGQ
jgi:hypothetical protein